MLGRKYLYELSIDDPSRLADIIDSGVLDLPDLTFAAEYFGQFCKDSERVKNTLIPLLYHEIPIIREGAVIGLAHHMDDEVRKLLENIAEFDSSSGVRKTAKEFMEIPFL